MGWLGISVIVYGIIMLLGGIMGYVIGHSVPSLASGIVSGMFLIGSMALAKTHPRLGYGIATLVTVLLIGVFIERQMKAPSGRNIGLIGLSLLMLVMLIFGHFMSGSRAEKPAEPPVTHNG